MFTCIYMGSDAIVKVWVWVDAQQLCEPECRRSDLEERVWWMEISLVQQRHLTMVGKCNMGASTMDAISRTFMFILLEEKGFECFFVFFCFFQGIKNEFHYDPSGYSQQWVQTTQHIYKINAQESYDSKTWNKAKQDNCLTSGLLKIWFSNYEDFGFHLLLFYGGFFFRLFFFLNISFLGWTRGNVPEEATVVCSSDEIRSMNTSYFYYCFFSVMGNYLDNLTLLHNLSI